MFRKAGFKVNPACFKNRSIVLGKGKGRERGNSSILKVVGKNIPHFDTKRSIPRYETYLIPGETLIPGGRGKRFTLVLDMPHIHLYHRQMVH